MKLARFGEVGSEKPGIVDDNGRLRDLSAYVDDISSTWLSDERLSLIRSIDVNSLPLVGSDMRLATPVANVRRIICIGLNYRDHAAETGLPIPAEPIVFLKTCHPSGPNDDVVLPRDSSKTDWEVELAVVIGKGGTYVNQQNALSYVAGYCLFNDVSEREYQLERGGQWAKGKNFPGFAPMGPWLVTRDEVKDPSALRLWLDVNGKRYQNGTTANLIFGVPELVSYVSEFFALEPGDVIATGTPAGVGLGQKPDPVFLKAGDTVELGIDGFGTQTQRVVAWSDETSFRLAKK
ncbi:fumarylacetoacetate hydrolase family protein [Paraburkholderia oxyphila]|uniref:fumarylacetoacetate hydrolase family protein n=1 Tax=Paraburkholderia oxyphila TaxID=614212 RepID=UPI000481B5E6|nr:fumarylacetoacetate hydrolase family protein [Paraburkholderia oxyphila]